MVLAGRYDEAYQHYAEACVLLRVTRSVAITWRRSSFIAINSRRARTVSVRPESPDSKDMALACLTNSGEILLDLTDYETAAKSLAAALQIDPTTVLPAITSAGVGSNANYEGTSP